MGYGARKQQGPATLADLEALPETLVGEIIDGTLYTHARPRPDHSDLEGALIEALRGPFQRERGGPGGWWIVVEPGIQVEGSPESSRTSRAGAASVCQSFPRTGGRQHRTGPASSCLPPRARMISASSALSTRALAAATSGSSTWSGDDLQKARLSDRDQRDRFPPSRRREAESFRAFRAARWRMEAQSSSLWTSIRANFLIRGREIRSRAFPAVPAIESPRFRKIVSSRREHGAPEPP
jgi:hypothetical protein